MAKGDWDGKTEVTIGDTDRGRKEIEVEKRRSQEED